MGMDIGVPTETKADERRVALTPAAVGELAARGHRVTVQSGAGCGAGFGDRLYKEAGAQIAGSATEVFDTAELVVKVKEPRADERAMLRPDHTLFTYLHLAADRTQTDDLLASGATCVAYETVTDDDDCPCSPPCLQSPGACPSRPVPAAWRPPRAAPGYSSAGCPASDPGGLW